mmetsp:Transcript_7726/g.20061  ORF Transcript_7726/g.20061 Transcript_7726/m.20061 type:complete len:103 (+) Transcript_7726:1919-2227(+)
MKHLQLNRGQSLSIVVLLFQARVDLFLTSLQSPGHPSSTNHAGFFHTSSNPQLCEVWTHLIYALTSQLRWAGRASSCLYHISNVVVASRWRVGIVCALAWLE